MKRAVVFLGVLLSATVAGRSAEAVLITYDFSGTVTTKSDTNLDEVFGIDVGDGIGGSFVFDTNAEPVPNALPDGDVYLTSAELTFTLGDHTITGRNNTYIVDSGDFLLGSQGLVSDRFPEYTDVGSLDFINKAELPLVSLGSLADLLDLRYFDGTFFLAGWNLGLPPVAGSEYPSLHGVIDSLVRRPPSAEVPEPSTLLVFGSGVLALLICGALLRRPRTH